MRLSVLGLFGALAEDCQFEDHPKSFLAGCSVNCESFATLAEAQVACAAETSCRGVTFSADPAPQGYQLRAGAAPQASTAGEESWLITNRGTCSPPAAAVPPVWPAPRAITAGNTTLSVHRSAGFFATTAPIPADALARIAKNTFPHNEGVGSQNGGDVKGLQISVESEVVGFPQMGVDESYSLTVGADGIAKLEAKTVWGALHGLETFSQLVVFDFDTGAYTIAGAPLSIQDSPRFPWRGLMLDTSRHFQPLESIRGIIDSLTYAKLNVLHWHMSDTQSFPMESKSHPKLWEGSFSNEERYLQADIEDMVEYARQRGVRVMVEFDMPGHAGSWCAGYPEVCPSTTCTQPLNVATNTTFDLITSLLNEMTGGKQSQPGKPSGLFPDDFIHLGGDEVDTTCWGKSEEITAWLKARNMTADDGYAYFVKRAADIALSQGRRPVQWVEVFDHFGSKLDKKTVIHVWKDKSTLQQVVAEGYEAILNNSPGSNSWYLDHLDVSWDAVYSNEPCSEVTDEQCKLVLGGQGEMWGETVDFSDAEQTIWPKLAAIGERLWSPRTVNSTALAQGRLENFRCMLNRRGVRSAPLTEGNARSAPPGPGGCHQIGGGTHTVMV